MFIIKKKLIFNFNFKKTLTRRFGSDARGTPETIVFFFAMGLYRENAIAIQNEYGDSNGGNV